jgi:branched-chain amino acid transport system substrate-binding protein
MAGFGARFLSTVESRTRDGEVKQTKANLGGNIVKIALSRFMAAAGFAVLATSVQTAHAQETIKIGIVGPFSGPFATTGVGFRQGLETYVAQHGTEVGGRKVQLIYRDSDTGASDPSVAKRLAQELVVNDNVALLGGFMLTPEAAAAAPVANEAKTPLLLFNAATPSLLGMSPYYIRMGQNIAQPAELGATWSRQQGKSRGYVATADYAPGHIVEEAFAAKFVAEGGTVVGKDRIPLRTVDFAPFAERIANANPDVLEVFIPPGAPAVGFIKALAARGLTKKVLIIGQGEAEDNDLHLYDDSVIGFHSIIYLSASLANPENDALKTVLHQKFGPGAEPSAFTIGAYDGLHIMYKMIESQAGRPFDGAAAIKSVIGYSWRSPRGPVTIAPSRELIQNFYVREVERMDGKLQNEVIKTFEQVQPPKPGK